LKAIEEHVVKMSPSFVNRIKKTVSFLKDRFNKQKAIVLHPNQYVKQTKIVFIRFKNPFEKEAV